MLFVCLLTVPTGVMAVEGNPNLSVALPDDDVAPGQETTLSIQLMNSGEIERGGQNPADEQRVTTARGVAVSVGRNDAPLEVKTSRQLLGAIQDGAVKSADVRVSVDDDAEPGTYRIPVRVSYDYTDSISRQPNVYDNEEVDETFYVTLRVEDSPQFRVEDVDTDVPVGDSGEVTMTLRNVGSAPANDSRVSLRSGSRQLTFGGDETASQFTGSWATNETRTVSVSASATPDADERAYPVTAEVSYEDEDGEPASAEETTTGVTLLPEQSFGLSDVESTLRVGEDGEVRATLTNDGPNAVTEAVVRLSTSATNVNALRTEYAIEALDAGESTTVTFPVAVSDAGESGPQRFSLSVEYQNREDESRTSDALPATVPVAEVRNQFVVEPVDTTLSAGASASVTVAVTNNGDDTVSNVNAKVFTDDPITAANDEAFATSIDPGERVELSFELGAAGSAQPKPYPVTMDFQYENADGEQQLSETYTVATEVTADQNGGGGLPVVPIVLVALVLLAVAGGVYYYYRER